MNNSIFSFPPPTTQTYEKHQQQKNNAYKSVRPTSDSGCQQQGSQIEQISRWEAARVPEPCTGTRAEWSRTCPQTRYWNKENKRLKLIRSIVVAWRILGYPMKPYLHLFAFCLVLLSISIIYNCVSLGIVLLYVKPCTKHSSLRQFNFWIRFGDSFFNKFHLCKGHNGGQCHTPVSQWKVAMTYVDKNIQMKYVFIQEGKNGPTSLTYVHTRS